MRSLGCDYVVDLGSGLGVKVVINDDQTFGAF